MLSEADAKAERPMRWWIAILVPAFLAACAAHGDSQRYRIGVSGDRPASTTPAANDQALRAFLDMKARQICTSGYKIVRLDTMSATDGRQIVDLDILCNAYRPDFAPDLSSLGGIF
jgi:hypothetical protein